MGGTQRFKAILPVVRKLKIAKSIILFNFTALNVMTNSFFMDIIIFIKEVKNVNLLIGKIQKVFVYFLIIALYFHYMTMHARSVLIQCMISIVAPAK